MARNTGKKKYTSLYQYDGLTNQWTGLVKPNDPSDPDYVSPIIDYNVCPTTTTTTTTIGNQNILVVFDEVMLLSVNIKIQKGTDEYSRNTAGTWVVPHLIYDDVVFEITGITASYQMAVYYGFGGGQVKYFNVDAGNNWNVMLPGPFFDIAQIVITKL